MAPVVDRQRANAANRYAANEHDWLSIESIIRNGTRLESKYEWIHTCMYICIYIHTYKCTSMCHFPAETMARCRVLLNNRYRKCVSLSCGWVWSGYGWGYRGSDLSIRHLPRRRLGKNKDWEAAVWGQGHSVCRLLISIKIFEEYVHTYKEDLKNKKTVGKWKKY